MRFGRFLGLAVLVAIFVIGIFSFAHGDQANQALPVSENSTPVSSVKNYKIGRISSLSYSQSHPELIEIKGVGKGGMISWNGDETSILADNSGSDISLMVPKECEGQLTKVVGTDLVFMISGELAKDSPEKDESNHHSAIVTLNKALKCTVVVPNSVLSGLK